MDRRVLIVEDEALVALELEQLIRRQMPDADVVARPSVTEARAAEVSAFGLALLDIQVGDGDTFALARELVAQGATVVFVSASPHEMVPAELAHLPFIAKPYPDQQVLDVVAAALGGARQ
jgi:DNA-binding LytR/AlgR family response regulator